MKLNRTRLLIAALLLVAIISVSFAILKYNEKISNTVHIKGYGLELWNTHDNTRVEAIAWGDMEVSATNDTEQIFQIVRELKVKNTGDYAYYVGWTTNNTLTAATLTCSWYDSVGAFNWQPLYESTQFIGTGNSVEIPIGGYSAALRWTLSIPAETLRETLDFDIILLAATTMSG